MKTWLIAGGIIGVIVIGGIVVAGLFIGRAVETHYVEGPLDKTRATIAQSLTLACNRDKKGQPALCACIGDKASRYLTDADAAAIVKSDPNDKAYKEATARFAQAAIRAGFVCGMEESRRKTRSQPAK